MTCNYSHFFRHYTPPTCTLQIYNPQSFWGRWPYQSFPEYFSFQLQFEDPRKGEQGKIIGDRTLLEKLRKEVNDYIQKYLAKPDLLPEGEKCDLPPQQAQGEYICISRESEYSHRFYYRSWESEQETLNIVLSNTQLLDLLNALEAYYQDACESRERKESISSHLGLSILITSLVFTGVGSWWWYYERESMNNPPISESKTETGTNTTSPTDNNELHKVLPPTPLDEKNLPQVITPTLPKNLQNLPPLPPPPPVRKPPIVSQSPVGSMEHKPLQPTFQPPSSISNSAPAVTVPSKKPTFSTIPSSPPTKRVSSNTPITQSPIRAMDYKPLPPAPQPPSPESPPMEKPKLPIRLSKLPVLSPQKDAPSPQSGVDGNVDGGVEGVSPPLFANDTLSKTISNLESLSPYPVVEGRKDNSLLIGQIKEYFSSRWLPPESLRQSIQYRLEINPEGAVTKITPIGQVAVVYLDKTGMPLLGEKIVSPPGDEDSPLTIRLILSPDGTVQAFEELQELQWPGG
ncbi:MAG: DUF4335 domain-containing protein [Geminocystis sp.]|nr:DUF4335 domain-containing protein [Geminocystis sp.]MCS7146865.1 DUF4335 domain-containing protein [Geminocystis sp.]MDW8115690.1 DUF4335 domain-containing protein [Geminocystis sp.]